MGFTVWVQKKELPEKNSQIPQQITSVALPLTVTPNISLVNTVPRELQVLSCHFQLDASYPHVELR